MTQRQKTTAVAPQAVDEAKRSWPPPQGQWTYEDWLRLPDDGWQYEVINSVHSRLNNRKRSASDWTNPPK